MRGVILILLMMAVLPAAWASPEVMLVGTVVSVDSEKGKMVLRPVGEEDSAYDMVIDIPVREGAHPPIIPGAPLRIWGRFADDSGARFVATDIARGFPPGPPADQTGVRRRLMRGPFPPFGRGHGGPPHGGNR